MKNVRVRKVNTTEGSIVSSSRSSRPESMAARRLVQPSGCVIGIPYTESSKHTCKSRYGCPDRAGEESPWQGPREQGCTDWPAAWGDGGRSISVTFRPNLLSRSPTQRSFRAGFPSIVRSIWSIEPMIYERSLEESGEPKNPRGEMRKTMEARGEKSWLLSRWSLLKAVELKLEWSGF